MTPNLRLLNVTFFFQLGCLFFHPIADAGREENEWIAYDKRTEIDSENSKAKKEEQFGNRPIIYSRRRLLTD
jgi:hypothetical protein